MTYSWITLKLSEICQIGSSKRIFLKDYVSNGIPFYRSKEIILKQKGEKISDVLYISDSKFQEIDSKYGSPKFNDILITSVGTLGIPYLIRKDEKFYFKDGNLTWLKNYKKDVIPKFIYYWILSPVGQNKIDEISIGSTQKAITIKSLNELKINLPSKEAQKAIANILSSLDDKIELNNKINQYLEELAQTLYKRWFVDFEFPNENGEPYKSSGGEMVDSELGLIPMGWEVREISELFNFKGGSQPPKSEHIYQEKEGYIRFIQNRDYKEDPRHLTYIKESKKNKLAKKLDILMDKYGEVGQIRFGIEGAYNVALAKIEPHNKSDLEYLRGYFSQYKIKKYLENSSIASTRGSLNKTTFTGLKLAYPTEKIKQLFSVLHENCLLRILKDKEENQKLAHIRDTLLPKLMNGEIEVPV